MTKKRWHWFQILISLRVSCAIRTARVHYYCITLTSKACTGIALLWRMERGGRAQGEDRLMSCRAFRAWEETPEQTVHRVIACGVYSDSNEETVSRFLFGHPMGAKEVNPVTTEETKTHSLIALRPFPAQPAVASPYTRFKTTLVMTYMSHPPPCFPDCYTHPKLSLSN